MFSKDTAKHHIDSIKKTLPVEVEIILGVKAEGYLQLLEEADLMLGEFISVTTIAHMICDVMV